MKRFYLSIFIFQTIFYAIFYIAAKLDSQDFTEVAFKVFTRIIIVFYIISVSVTVLYPILISKIRQKNK